MLAPGPIELVIIAAIVLVVVVIPAVIILVLLFGSKTGPFGGRNNPNLRPCPDCRKYVSRQATHCPNCGCPLDAND